jgi:type IV secretory pathway VirB3-like protein
MESMSAPSEDQRQVPPYVALVRIAAVIGMSATIAFGIFLLIAAVWVPALISLALSLPFFALMRLVEGSVDAPNEPPPSGPDEGEP